MPKLSSSQYNELRDFLRSINIPPDFIKAALSSANQVNVYQHYQKHQDFTLDSHPPIVLKFSLFENTTPDDVIQQSTKSDTIKTAQNLRELLSPEKTISDNVRQKDTISDNVIKTFTKPKSKANLSSFSVRIDDLERQQLQKIAEEFGVPLSTVFRWAIKDYLKQGK